MVFTEISISINVMLIIIITIKRKQFIENFKKRNIINKIFILGLLSYSFLTAIAQIFFLFDIPFNPLSLLPYDILNLFINPFITFICLGCACLLWVFRDYKSTTPKTKTKRFNEKSLVELFNSNSIQGSGQRSNPYVIEDQAIFPKNFNITIKRSHNYILFKNHTIIPKKFKKCSYITFENCVDSQINLKNCAEIFIKNCTLNRLDLTNCVHIFVEQSTIRFLNMFSSFLNRFDDCSITQISKKYSPDNTFNIKEKLVDEGRKSNVFQNYVPTIMIFIFVLLIFGNYFYVSYVTTGFNVGDFIFYFSFILISSMILGFILLFIIGLSIDSIKLQIKVKKYYKERRKLNFNLQKFFIGWAVLIGTLLGINVFYSLYYFDYITWIIYVPYEVRLTIFFTVILASAISMTFGFDFMLRSIETFKEKIFKKSNPLYPEFTLFNLFLIIYGMFILLGLSLYFLYDIMSLMTPALIILTSIELVIAILVLIRYKKLKKQNQTQRFKLVFSIFLFSYPMILLSFFHNLSASIFEIILLTVLTVILAFIGILSLPNNLLKAFSYQSRGKYEKSVKAYHSALQVEPKNEIGWYNLGMIQFKDGDYANSLIAFKKVVEINPQNNNALLMIGNSAANTRDFDLALQSCEKALRNIKNPVLSTSKNLFGSMRDMFQSPVKEEVVWHVLGYVYVNKEDYAQAIEASKNALELNPNLKETWLTLAAAYSRIGEYSKAFDACDRSLKLDDKFEFAWSRLGKVYQSKGDLDLALQMIKKAIEINPKEHNSWITQAEIFVDLKNFGNALKSINMALKIKPGFNEALKLREEIYKKMDKNKQ